MADIKSVASDPGFWNLSRPAQLEVLNQVDADFSGLPEKSKHEVIETFRPGREAMPKKPFSSLLTATANKAPSFIGGVIGGLAASPGLVSTPLGVAGGAAAGEAIKEGIKQAIYPETRKPILDTAKGVAMRGGEEGLYQAGGGLVAKGVGKLIAPFAKKVTPEAKEVMDTYGGRIKPALLPSEATESRLLDVAQNVAEHSLVGGGKISAFKQARQKELDKIADEIVDQYGQRLTPEELGTEMVNILHGKQSVFKEAARKKYDEVERIAAGIQEPTMVKKKSQILDSSGNPIVTNTPVLTNEIVSTARLKQFAMPIQEQAKNVSNIKSSAQGDDLINAVINLPEKLNFQEAQELRSRLLSIAEEFSVQNKNAPAIGKARAMVKMIDQEMGSALRANPAAYSAWREANDFYRKESERLNNQFLRKLIRAAEENGTGPEVIGGMIFKPGAVSNIKKVKAAVDPQDWQKFQGFYVQHAFKQSTDAEGVIQGTRLLNNLVGKPGSMGDPTLKEIFSPAQIKELKNFASALKLSQAKQAGGTGSVWIQLTQAGAAGGLMLAPADEKVLAGSAAILMTPPMLAKLLTNPKTARLLSTGYRLPPNSPQLAGITARLMHAVYGINRERQMIEQAIPESKATSPQTRTIMTK